MHHLYQYSNLFGFQILRDKDGDNLSIDVAHNIELEQSNNESKSHKKRQKKPPSSRFFDLDTSGDSIELKPNKAKHSVKLKKQKRLLEPKKSTVFKESQNLKKKSKRKRGNKGQIEMDFKKQKRLINEQKKATRSASIDETIQEVIGAVESDNEMKGDEMVKSVQE